MAANRTGAGIFRHLRKFDDIGRSLLNVRFDQSLNYFFCKQFLLDFYRFYYADLFSNLITHASSIHVINSVEIFGFIKLSATQHRNLLIDVLVSEICQ